MNKNIHTFIIWNSALDNKEQIIAKVAAHFRILKMLLVSWTKEKFSENLTSFYEEDFRGSLHHLRERGVGPFLVVVAEDPDPHYHMQLTRRGMERVNSKAFYLKQAVRDEITHTFNFHSSINEAETRNNIVKLTGRSLDDFLNATPLDCDLEVIERDCPGVNGWSGLRELFCVLNECMPYVVLRNFHALPDQHRMSVEGDLDLLVQNLPAFLCILQPQRDKGDNAFRFFNWMDIGDQNILIHPKFVGDNYYDKAMQQRMIDSRERNASGIYVPNSEMYFWSLLYHGLFHKENYAKYLGDLARIAPQIGVSLRNDKEYLCGLLSKWMLDNRYSCRLHLDGQAAHLNPQNLRLGLTDRTRNPRIFAYPVIRFGACITYNYICEALLRDNEAFFGALIQSEDPLCDLDRHVLDPRSPLYRELLTRYLRGDMCWRYSVRCGDISEMSYSHPDGSAPVLTKRFLSGRSSVAGRNVIYRQEVSQMTHKGRLVSDLLGLKATEAGVPEAYAYLRRFVSAVIGQFSVDANTLQPVAWDMLPKNCLFTETGEYQFFDFEAEFREVLPLSYYLGVLAEHAGNIWSFTGAERNELYVQLCADFGQTAMQFSVIQKHYYEDVKEVALPGALAGSEMYQYYFNPPVLHDMVRGVSEFTLAEPA